MKKYVFTILVLSLFLFLFVFVFQACAQDQDSTYSYSEETSRKYYYINGQKHNVLLYRPWGAIVYMPQYISDLAFETSNVGEYVIKTPSGKVTVKDTVGNETAITYPDGKVLVKSSMGDTRVKFKGKEYVFDVEQNQLTVKTPDDTIAYKKEVNKLVISGKKGKVTYEVENNVYTITSSAGVTKYEKDLTGGYELKGVPIASHPYRYWGVEFFLPEFKMGIIIDLNSLFPMTPVIDIFEWEEVMVVH